MPTNQIETTQVLSTLNHLQSLYDSEQDSETMKLLGKVGLIELCGWLEMSIDKLILSVAVLNEPNLKFLNGKIKKITTFEYEKSIKELLIFLKGLEFYEKFESDEAIQSDITLYKSKTETEKIYEDKTLITMRHAAAHTLTSLSQITNYNAPSYYITYVNNISSILIRFKTHIDSLLAGFTSAPQL